MGLLRIPKETGSNDRNLQIVLPCSKFYVQDLDMEQMGGGRERWPELVRETWILSWVPDLCWLSFQLIYGISLSSVSSTVFAALFSLFMISFLFLFKKQTNKPISYLVSILHFLSLFANRIWNYLRIYLLYPGKILMRQSVISNHPTVHFCAL